MSALQEAPWIEKVSEAQDAVLMRRGPVSSGRVNLFRIAWLRPLFKSRWPQFVLRALMLAGFVFAILAGLFGSVVGSHNFAIIFVWIAWWSAFKLVFVPLGGRSWCSICPIPLPGEWLQRGGIFHNGSGLGKNLRWPKRLKGAWLQAGIFMMIGLFSALTLTDPRVTGWVFLAIFVAAIALSLVFEKRAFCTHLCPIGGISSIYAKPAPVELRVIDTDICAGHAQKTCYQACPWGLYPVAFRDNTSCGLCMECLRACPEDNLALNLRPFGVELEKPKATGRLDEAFMSLVMLASVLAFAAVFIGPWGWLKSAALEVGSISWTGYAAGFLTLNLFVVPGLFWLAVWAGLKFTQVKFSFKREVANLSQALLPLGLMAWIAFTISFALPKAGTVLWVINDPLGWGWNLLRPGSEVWSPEVTMLSSLLQAGFVLIGLFWSSKVVNRLTGASFRRAVPVLLFCLLFSLVILWLLVG